jgi:cyclophilin family peptidyl-prolyl cis-trans isomerase
MKSRMRFMNKKSIIASTLLAVTLGLGGCGGGNSSNTDANVASLSGPPSAPPAQLTQAAPSADIVTFNASRNDYIIKTNAYGFSIVNKASSSDTTNLTSTQTTVKFNDFTVSLLAGNKSKTIAQKDLDTLIELYIAFFNRVPDAEGMIYWIGTIKDGRTIEQLADNFYTSAIDPKLSAVTGYTPNMSTEEFVRKIYKNVLGRDEVDQGGLDYWSAEIISGRKSRGNLIRDIIDAAHGSKKNNPAYGWVTDLLDNKVIVGKYFSIQHGLNYNTANESITKGVEIAALVTPTDTTAAKSKIGITDTALDLNLAKLIPQVMINTSMGSILVELDPIKAPITVTNFLRYTDVGFYSNKIFHRVISNFMIQGGGLTTSYVPASTYAPIKLEANNGLSNLRGTIAMARMNDDDTATSQFFINVVDNPFLNPSANSSGYAVFGRVIAGLDVVDKIKVVPTERNKYGYIDAPKTTVLINSVTRAN